MALRTIHINGFKSFAADTKIHFYHPVTAIVGPNGSGKSNVADAIRFALGEQSMKSLRGGKGEDLIFNGSHKVNRKNRAHVTLRFSNERKMFDTDSTEVELQRLVHRDGVNEYLVNSNKTRLKDKLEFIASANIGPTGHHMITQGSADKYVVASDVDRRQLIEDALGLNVYKLRRKEAESKLEKTAEKLLNVNNLVDEVEPIVKTLNAEVTRLESLKAKESVLVKLYAEMFYLWQRWLADESLSTENELQESLQLQEKLEIQVKELAVEVNEGQVLTAAEIELQAKKKRKNEHLDELQSQSAKLARSLGEVEGSISHLKARLDKIKSLQASAIRRGSISTVSIDTIAVEKLHTDIQNSTSLLGAKQAESHFYRMCLGDGVAETSQVTDFSKEIQEIELELTTLESQHSEKMIKSTTIASDLKNLQTEIVNIDSQISLLATDRLQSVKELERSRSSLENVRTRIIALNAKQSDLESSEKQYRDRRQLVGSIHGRDAIDRVVISIPAGEKLDHRLRETKRQVLRLEAQLEDVDVSALPALRNDLEIEGSRLLHLQTERHDVEVTMERTKSLVNELTTQIELKIELGLNTINQNLEHFFRVLFGGGSCLLKSNSVEGKKGVEINLQLPYKRIKSVHALSGGERSLASLAILFAITLLSPPPFVVLDETDAALDEANSRRYAKLIRELASHTQLILITHNRETMTFADELYGVTMGSDGVSRLLSVTLTDNL